MKIVYITAETPWGRGETFVLEEMLELNKFEGVELSVIPRNPPRECFYAKGNEILPKAKWEPLFSVRFLPSVIKNLISKEFWLALKTIIFHSRTFLMMIKNLSVFPKAVYIADHIKMQFIDHMHVHWGSTTATIGYVVSKLTGVPWSITLHRWDITENNFLREKLNSAQFVRCISNTGREELLSIVGREYEEKVFLIHMGVHIPPEVVRVEGDEKELIIACPANLLPVKGHKYLIKACEILRNRSIRFICLIIGGGNLEAELKLAVESMGLSDCVHFTGQMDHKELINMYQQGRVNVVVLPSINTEKGEHEGIPVALMEAMAFGIPVISTKTGGIPELLHDGAGILVDEKNADELANAIQVINDDKKFRMEIGNKGRFRVAQDFNQKTNVHKLLTYMSLLGE